MVEWRADGQYKDGVRGEKLITVAKPGMGAVIAKIYQHQMAMFGDLEYMLDLHVLELNQDRLWTLVCTGFYFAIYQVWYAIGVIPF